MEIHKISKKFYNSVTLTLEECKALRDHALVTSDACYAMGPMFRLTGHEALRIYNLVSEWIVSRELSEGD